MIFSLLKVVGCFAGCYWFPVVERLQKLPCWRALTSHLDWITLFPAHGLSHTPSPNHTGPPIHSIHPLQHSAACGPASPCRRRGLFSGSHSACEWKEPEREEKREIHIRTEPPPTPPPPPLPSHTHTNTPHQSDLGKHIECLLLTQHAWEKGVEGGGGNIQGREAK